MRRSSAVTRSLSGMPVGEAAEVQEASNVGGDLDCMTLSPVDSRDVEQLHTTQDTEEIVVELAANQGGVTLTADVIEIINQRQPLEQLDGSDASSGRHPFWSNRWRWSILASLLGVIAIAVGVAVVIVGNEDSTLPVDIVSFPPPRKNSAVNDAYLQEIRTILVPPPFWGEANAPQLRAAEFMAYADSPNHVSVTSPRLQQRYALLVLYFSNGGEKWRINPEFHECDWKFCVCKNTSVVAKLFMGNQLGMTGLLPGEIGLLTDLEHLDLQRNRLEGKLPESLFNLTKLVELRLNSNMFASSISEHVGRLTNLESFYIHDNFFEGTLPETLQQLSRLKNFRVGVNWFSGTILDTALSWPNLEEFRITGTFLAGTLPTGIGLLTNLRHFEALRTIIGGTLPSEVGRLSMLKILVIADTQLTGPIPTEFGNLGALEILLFNQNSLSSTIPTEFGKLSKIESLALPWNTLNGTIPTELGLLPKIEELFLNGNKLTGSVPSELGLLTTLRRLQIHLSGLLGSVPSEICELRRGFGRGELVEFVNSCIRVACAQPECCSDCVEGL